ncbi:thiaminase II [Comamonas sp. JNW]|jgi:thiaminase/transcriptional activator TenA|uniref:thiaminase II n=1 Tax=Comamonas sp. JNW TaxID=2170731 RepID=UPI000DE73750|nr:thiaminase II [Comamonas sp. JNW]PWB18542.1 thiaminase II [Comamonas sp. JNW]
MSFCQALWQANQALYQRTLDHPFNRELAAGSLSVERFRHYMIQDAHYLVAYGRALAVAAAKADQAEGVVQFANAANEAVAEERKLHDGFMRDFGITPQHFAATPLTPACHHYTSFLLANSWSQSYPVALAGLLPCFWIYAEVGRDIHARSQPGNPYQAWVDTYASEEFHAAVRGVIATIDRVAESADSATRTRMAEAYRYSAELEWMFWDSAYQLGSWPTR